MSENITITGLWINERPEGGTYLAGYFGGARLIIIGSSDTGDNAPDYDVYVTDGETQRVRVGGMWKNTSANGVTYFSGNLGRDARLVVFENSFKEKETHPDYRLLISARQRNPGNGGGYTPPAPGGEDIPF